MSQETDAVRETVAEWMRHQAERVESGHYVDDLPVSWEEEAEEVSHDEGSEILSPGFRWKPDRIPFDPHMGFSLLATAVRAITAAGRLDERSETPAGRFVSLLEQASQDLERVLSEVGPNLDKDAMQAALPKLEEAAALRGSPDGVDFFIETLGDGDLNHDVATHLHTASYALDWALAGCQARLEGIDDTRDAPLPGSHAAYDPGYFKEDGLFYGPARCHHCATVEELDGVERKERGGEPARESVRGFSGVYLDATCPGCGSAFLAMEDGKLAPVVGSRAW